MMKCGKCQISVKPYFTYCPNCGARLRIGEFHFNYSILFIIAFFLVCASGIYEVFFKTDPKSVPGLNSSKNSTARANPFKGDSLFPRILFSSPQVQSPAVSITAGRVAMYDIAGTKIAEIATAVSESGWVAIPAHLCVGGYRWVFHSATGEDLEIFGGIVGDHDDIGIWQFKNSSRISGPPIFPANPDVPMTWMSIVSERSAELTAPPILSEQQNFYHVSLDDSMNEPGVLIQDQKIVGWTFGDLTGGGYLWKGPDEKNLVYELSVYDFYRLTFENSREEQFIIGYSQKELSPLKQLETFAGGFRLEPMLFDDNTPAHLKSPAVIAKMRLLMSQIIDQGNLYGIGPICDSRVLSAAGDVSFLMDVMKFDDQVRGPEYSIDIIEDVLANPGNFNESQEYQIREFQKDLYRRWLTLLINDGNYSKGLEVYHRATNFFTDDPEIHLLGVKLALVFNDWQTAEEILYSHRFPIDLTDQVRTLEGQIKELKFQENKIVVRFSPGSGRISASGMINNQLSQKFVIDTGASMVTIPAAAAKKLGIQIDGSTPVRELVTAGGMIAAPEVILDSIQLEGWTEYNVTAYVVDMPDQSESGFGLLGLNYLKRFRMDLNTKAGVLTLAPR